MSEAISLVGLDKAAVLAALYNASKPQGMGFLHYDPTPMTVEQARQILEQTPRMYFDYLGGRVMKVDLSGDELNPCGFDRDNGQGAVATAIRELQQTGDPNSPIIQATHHINTLDEAERTSDRLQRDHTHINDSGGVTVVHMGISDMEPVLRPAINEAVRKRRES